MASSKLAERPAPAVSIDPLAVLRTIKEIMDEQNDIFVARHDDIRMSWIALLARVHVFFLGIPGVAKSMLIRDICRRIAGAKYFTKLITKETSRSEIFGPQDILALDRGEFRFNTKNHLADCHMAFIDEPFKGTSMVLNSMLFAMNERKFDNGGTEMDIPLMSMFSGSNELMEGKEQAAFFDRYLLRFYVPDLENDSDFFELLRREPSLSGPAKAITLDELKAVQEFVDKVVIPDDVKAKLVEVRLQLRAKAQLTYGPRRWKEGLNIVRAAAAIDGVTTATEDHLSIYEHILWDTLEERSKTRKIVLSVVNPINERLLEIIDDIAQKFRDVKSAVDREATDLPDIALNAQNAMRKAKKDLKKLRDETSSETMKRRIDEETKGLNTQLRYVLEHGLGVSQDTQD